MRKWKTMIRNKENMGIRKWKRTKIKKQKN